MKKNTIQNLLAIASILTVSYLLAIAFNVFPALRGPDDWRWARAIPGMPYRLWLPLLVIVVYITLAGLIQKLTPQKRRLCSIGLSIIAIPIIQLSLLFMDHVDVRSQLFYRTVSESAGGFYNVGVSANVDTTVFLKTYAEQMPTFPVHPQRHPPGLPLLFLWSHDWLEAHPQLARLISNELRPFQCHNLELMALSNAAVAAAVLQMAVPLLLSLLIPPLYYLGRLHYEEDVVNRAVLLFPLIPSVGLWATRWNHLYGLFLILCLLFLCLGLNKKRPLYFFVSGLVISVASFFSFGNFALIAFVGSYGLLWLIIHKKWPFESWLIFGVLSAIFGIATVWLMALFFEVNLVTLMQTSLSLHYGLKRSYWLWLGYHLYDFFVFFGIPLAVLWFYQLFKSGSDWRAKHPDILMLAFALGLFLLNISGTSQGEVARVWAFLLPVALLTGAQILAANNHLFIGILSLLALQLFVGNIFLRTVGTGLSHPPMPPAEVYLVPDAQPVNWSNGPILLSAEAKELDSIVKVKTLWTTNEQIDKPYTIFMHMLDQDGNLIAQDDGHPRNGEWLTTCWQQGATFEDQYDIAVPADYSAESMVLKLGFYWLPTGERLLISGTQDDATLIE